MIIELHAHTKEKSSCGQVAVCDMIDIYREKGYDAVVITNHLNPWTIGIKEAENDWEGFIDSFLEPVDIGREYAEKYGMKIFFGCEIRFSENDNDYLVYGITAEYLKKNPDILEWGIGKFFEESKTEGFLVYQAHPFRDGMTVTRTKYLHGIEVNNGHPGQNSRNDIARLWADMHGLSMISGSDFHEVGHEARGGIITFRDINDEKELCEILKNGEYRLICDYSGGFLR